MRLIHLIYRTINLRFFLEVIESRRKETWNVDKSHRIDDINLKIEKKTVNERSQIDIIINYDISQELDFKI